MTNPEYTARAGVQNGHNDWCSTISLDTLDSPLLTLTAQRCTSGVQVGTLSSSVQRRLDTARGQVSQEVISQRVYTRHPHRGDTSRFS